jgi:hypothetical protein
MQKSMLTIVCVFFLTSTLSGCAGLVLSYPVECKNELPSTSARNVLLWDPKNPPQRSTKEEFLKEWGKPTKILSTSENKDTRAAYETCVSPSENRETWVYERHLWCGIIPVFILPVPLVLPVCDGFDRIEFQGSEAKNLHIRRIRFDGGILFPVAAGGSDPVCRYNIPIDIGMDRAQVAEIMGDPYKIEVYALEGKQIDVLFYSKKGNRLFRVPFESDFIPVFFENNRVTAWGQFHFERMTKKTAGEE